MNTTPTVKVGQAGPPIYVDASRAGVLQAQCFNRFEGTASCQTVGWMGWGPLPGFCSASRFLHGRQYARVKQSARIWLSASAKLRLLSVRLAIQRPDAHSVLVSTDVTNMRPGARQQEHRPSDHRMLSMVMPDAPRRAVVDEAWVGFEARGHSGRTQTRRHVDAQT
jgi:hypothetical protein